MKMKQNEVDFKVKSYLTKGEYEKDGCPVQYFEFNSHEYYGLVAVKDDFGKMTKLQKALTKTGEEKAFAMYVKEIAGDSVDEIKVEGYPKLISKSEALLKFLLAQDNAEESVEEVINQFTGFHNGALLVDSSLL